MNLLKTIFLLIKLYIYNILDYKFQQNKQYNTFIKIILKIKKIIKKSDFFNNSFKI